MSDSFPLTGVMTAETSITIVESQEYQARPPRSATIRGMAGETMVWPIDAVNIPTTSPAYAHLTAWKSKLADGFPVTWPTPSLMRPKVHLTWRRDLEGRAVESGQ